MWSCAPGAAVTGGTATGEGTTEETDGASLAGVDDCTADDTTDGRATGDGDPMMLAAEGGAAIGDATAGDGVVDISPKVGVTELCC